MTYAARSLWLRVKVNDLWVTTTGEIRISESLDQLARVAEFEIAEQPEIEPVEGDDVLIEWFDFTADLYYPLFGGEVNAVESESQPWQFVIRAVDQLALLRRVRTGSDLDLSTMTDGEAWKAVMDYVGVTYDDADVADAGYVLGEFEPVKWLIDTPASQVIGELDTVFGMVTETIGNNRVIRFPYDPVPDDGTGSFATYERAVTIDFRSNRRIHGDRDRIQNVWVVRGATTQFSDSCTATAWARAAISNPQLGRKVRVATQTFQSDLIQSEDLAEQIARRQMRITNRLPDDATASLVNDPNVHPGSKITIQDATYGVDADPRYFLVTAVDRQGTGMTLALTAGPPGDEGTVTTGVDKVCSDTHTDLNWPGGGFTFPGFDFPPINLGLDIDFGIDLDIPSGFGGAFDPAWLVTSSPGGSEGTSCEDAIGPDDESDWTTDLGTAIAISGGELTCAEGASAYNDAIAIGWGDDWQLTAVIEGGVVGPGTPEPTVGIVTDYSFGTGASIAMYDDGASIDVIAPGDSSFFTLSPFDVETASIWTLTRLGAWVYWSITQGSNHYTGALAWDSPTETGALAIRVLSNNGNLIATSMQLCTGSGIGEVVASPDWTALTGSWTFGADDEAHNSETTDADAYAAGHVFDGTERCRWRGAVAFGATDECIFTFALDDTEGAATGNICGFQVYVSATPQVDVYTFDGFQETLSLDLSGGFVFLFDADPGDTEFRLVLDGVTRTYPLGTWPGDKTLHIEHGTGLTVDLDVTLMNVVVGG